MAGFAFWRRSMIKRILLSWPVDLVARFGLWLRAKQVRHIYRSLGMDID